MRVLVLTRHELRVMWNELRLSLRKKAWVSTYVLMASMAAGVFFVLHLFLFEVSEEARQAIAVAFPESLELLNPFNLFLLSSMLWLLYRVQSGLFSENLAKQYGRADVAIVFSSPVPPAYVFLSKHLAKAARRATILTLAFLAVVPLLRYMVIGFLSAALLFLALFVFVESSYFLEEVAFFLIHTGKPLRERLRNPRLFLVVGIVIALLAWGVADTAAGSLVVEISPPHSLSRILQRCHVASVACSFAVWAPSLFYLGAFTLGTALSSLVASAGHYDWVVKKLESPHQLGLLRFPARGRLGIFLRGRPVLSLFLKESWTKFRERGGSVVAELALGYGILATVTIIRPTVLGLLGANQAVLASMTPAVFFIASLVTILASPSPDSLGREMGELWVYKTSPLPFRRVVAAKFLHSTGYTLLLTLPVVLAVSLFLPSFVLQVWTVATWSHVLCLSNAIGTLVGARLLSSFKERGLVSLPTHLVYVALSLLASIPILLFLVFMMDAWRTFQSATLLLTLLAAYSIVTLNQCLRLASTSYHET
ncbi:MAG: hypothetical protein ACE5KH_00490 [Candidatus Geothermarchaeales archaeon]